MKPIPQGATTPGMMAVPTREGTLEMLAAEHLKLPPQNSEPAGAFPGASPAPGEHPPSARGAEFPHAEQQPQQICP